MILFPNASTFKPSNLPTRTRGYVSTRTLPRIEFVYFDLDDTLLDHRHAEQMALGDVCEAFAQHFGHVPVERVREVYHAQNVELWRRYGAGEIDKPELRQLRFELLLDTLAIEGADAGTLDAHYMDRYARYWTIHEEARAAFHAIADRFPVGVLTNGFFEVQEAKLAQFPEIRDRLAATVVSEEVGYFKPHPALFAHAAEVAGTKPDAILYVGDSFRSDVEGALRAGWQAAWFTSEQDESGGEEPFFRFSDWNDLVRWLGA